MDKKISRKKAYDWMVLPDSYLGMSLILLREILKNNSFDSLLKQNGFRSGHPDESLISPIIFCLKHGVELYIKAIIGLNGGSFNQIHDIKDLLDQLNDTTLARGIWNIVKKYYYGTYLLENNRINNPDKLNESERYPETNCGYNVNLKLSGEIDLHNLLRNIEVDI